jgi:cytochrome b involved in lipid metabolism
MGKGSDKGRETSTTTTTKASESESPRLFKWDEIKKHNRLDDCWIVVNDAVYDVTKFMKNHPGGGEVINLYAGQYATVRIKRLFAYSDLTPSRITKYTK